MIILLKVTTQSFTYQKEIQDMLDEWTNTKEKITPNIITKYPYRDFEGYINFFKEVEKREDNHHVPNSTYWIFDNERHLIVGAVSIRHYLNTNLKLIGGHIGIGVRPSERRKRYATLAIEEAKKICKELGINRILMTCNKENIGSAKSIMNNGGILENELIVDNILIQRYWIENYD